MKKLIYTGVLALIGVGAFVAVPSDAEAGYTSYYGCPTYRSYYHNGYSYDYCIPSYHPTPVVSYTPAPVVTYPTYPTTHYYTPTYQYYKPIVYPNQYQYNPPYTYYYPTNYTYTRYYGYQ